MATSTMNRTKSGRINKEKKRRPLKRSLYRMAAKQLSSLSSARQTSLLSAVFRPQTASPPAIWRQVPRSAGSDCSSSADELAITVSRLTPSSHFWTSSASSDSSAAGQQDYNTAPREALAVLLGNPISFVSAAAMTNWKADKDTALRKPAKKKRSQKQEMRDRLVRVIVFCDSITELDCFSRYGQG